MWLWVIWRANKMTMKLTICCLIQSCKTVTYQKACNCEGIATQRPLRLRASRSGILSAFSGFLCSKILRFGKFRVATTNAGHVTPRLLSTINYRKRAIAKALHLERPTTLRQTFWVFRACLVWKYCFRTFCEVHLATAMWSPQGPHNTKIMKPPLKLPPNMAADSLRQA